MSLQAFVHGIDKTAQAYEQGAICGRLLAHKGRRSKAGDACGMAGRRLPFRWRGGASTLDHPCADGIRVRCIAKRHDPLKTSGGIQIALVLQAVICLDAVVDTSTGIRPLVCNGEASQLASDSNGGTLCQSVLTDGGCATCPDSINMAAAARCGVGGIVRSSVMLFPELWCSSDSGLLPCRREPYSSRV